MKDRFFLENMSSCISSRASWHQTTSKGQLEHAIHAYAITSMLASQLIIAGKLIVTLSALGVKGSRRDGFAETEFSLSRMFTFRGFNKPARLLMRGVELSTADMRAAFALRLTTDGLRLHRSAELNAFLSDLGTAPDLLALGPAEGAAR